MRCRSLLVLGCVGESAGLALLASMAGVRVPEAGRALADPDGFAIPIDRDKALAVLGAVASMAISRGDPTSWSRAARLVARAAKAAPEVASVAAKALGADRPPGAEIPGGLPALGPASPAIEARPTARSIDVPPDGPPGAPADEAPPDDVPTDRDLEP